MRKLFVTLLMGAFLMLPLSSALAMDALTQSQLGDVDGQAGVSIGFGDMMTTTVGVDFTRLSWGDPDGYSTANSAGWLILDGAITTTITTEIEGGEVFSLDIADNQTGGSFTPVTGIDIPNNTSFMVLSLPSTSIGVGLSLPSEFGIGLANTSGATLGDTNTLGMLSLSNLSVSVDAGTIDSLYVWAH